MAEAQQGEASRAGRYYLRAGETGEGLLGVFQGFHEGFCRNSHGDPGNSAGDEVSTTLGVEGIWSN